MSKYLCLDCGNIFNKISEYNQGNYNYCPIATCNGYIIEIDDNMIYIIKTLNEKGYYTKFCCGGHAYDKCNNIYIMFDLDSMEVDNINFITLPKGFKIESEDTIRHTKNTNIGIEKQKLINKTNLELCRWVEKLEPFEGG